ncbi:MAG: CotH kinase family protein, partial [Bacteroidales bacterium]|nr:CotH kinase family protein [Bacteroidales bacterium]
MRYKSLLKELVVFPVVFLFPLLTTYGQIDFPAGSNFRFLKGNDAAGLSSQWMNAGFDDSGWNVGNAPIRYGDGTGGTVLDDMQNNYSVVYMRTSFTAHKVDSLESISLMIDYDDGYVIWINGTRVYSQYAPAILSYDGFATDLHESGVIESIVLESNIANLVEGENTLAIQVFNFSLESSDLLMDLSMNAEVIDPVLQDSVGLSFSFQSGFYNDPFYLEIVPSDPAWQVRYTIDGSNPQDSETTIVGSDTARILVDPNSVNGRPQTPVFVVRASSAMNGILPSVPESRTFIFLDEVLQQGYPGGEWPTENINGQLIDLPMDQRIVTHQDYKNEMIPAMTDIPSISVITDLDHLFDPETGIYVNAYGHGFEWERECSVELLNPDGSEGFGVNAGLRIRGGWSRHPEFPKHAFRLFFRSEYGDAKLDYPLFGDEGVDRFDKIDLRTAQNWAWTHPHDPSHNTFLRDVFSRDTQRDMGQPYTRSRFYHLYLNGMYWGLFQTQ